MHVAALYLYPVKSLRGIAVARANLDALGLVGDRRFLVVDAAGKFLTQRAHPRMALIATALTADALTLSHPAQGSISVGLGADGAPASVVIWRDTVTAVDCGDAIAAWLSATLGQPCRLVRIGEDYVRPVNPAKAQPGDAVTFVDAYPLLAISEGSLADLNDRLVAQGEAPVPMDRFRPNLVVRDCAPYAEDAWQRVRAGEIVLRSAGACIRCTVPTVDPLTAERGPEPIRTLATYRRLPDTTHVVFGQNLIHETKSGVIRVGDPVDALD